MSIAKVFDWVKRLRGTRFWVYFKNLGTDFVCLDPDSLELTEFDEKGVSLRMPRTMGAAGHHAMLCVCYGEKRPDFKSFPSKATPTRLLITCKITESHQPEENEDLCVAKLEFLQYEEKEWAAFLEKLNEHQRLLGDLIRKARE